MNNLDREALQADLIALFEKYDVNVAVGLIADGVAIRSQDERIDAHNIGKVTKR